MTSAIDEKTQTSTRDSPLDLPSLPLTPSFTFATRRELGLLAALLVGLLFITSFPANQILNAEVDSDGLEVRGTGHGLVTKLGVFPESTLRWQGPVPETKIVAHAAGWTIFEQLYMMNGTLFIVTSDSKSVPKLGFITSTGRPVLNGPEERKKQLPTDEDIQVITPGRAQELFGASRRSATMIDGTNFMCSDARQFITHYYHFTAELVFGLWRAYSSLDPYMTIDGLTSLPLVRRWIFRHVDAAHWRDYASMNQWVLRGGFPGVSVEFAEDWAERAEMQTPFVFERVVLGDRAAAHEGEPYKSTWRPASNAFELHGSPHWWMPVRRSVLEYSGVAPEWIVGPDPSMLASNQKFVITYISRQGWGRRMLRQADHERLVEELYNLRDLYGYEVNVVSMDKLSRAEQLQLAGRTTIMMGVHGNGLTSLVWMKPTPRSTVVEFFFPTGFAFDYEYTTRALGMTHYGVWDNVTFTRPGAPNKPHTPVGFQGNDIPLNGAVVARLVHKRLMLESVDGDDF